MAEEPKQLDALIVDVEDSTTLLKLYVGRLMKAPARAMFYQPLVEHSSEIASAVADLSERFSGRVFLVRIADVLQRLVADFDEAHPATLDRILKVQECVDLLESQLDHMLQLRDGAARDVLDGVASLERLLAPTHEEPALAFHGAPSPSEPRELTLEEIFEDDPFDEFALTDDFLDELVSDFDAALEASIEPTAHEPTSSAKDAELEALPTVMAAAPATGVGQVELSESDQAALKELFEQIASGYVGPITDFIAKLRVGAVTTGWVDLCVPAISSMMRATESMGYAKLRDALNGFGQLLEEARSASRVVDGDMRARVFAKYQTLSDLMPTTFPIVVADAHSESESIILNSLLKQIKGVGRVTIGRLFSAGLVSLDSFYVADPGDLAAAAGLRLNLAERICNRFRMYKEVSELAEDKGIVVRRLETLLDDLRAAQFEYKKATLEEWYTHQPSRAKAKARRSRQQVMWKINVALAELGELKLLNTIKDEIYDKRINLLKDFLESRKARGTTGGLRA